MEEKFQQNTNDSFLTTLVSTVNGGDLTLGITLNVHGTVISGIMISAEEYIKGLGETLKNSGSKIGQLLGDKFINELSQNFKVPTDSEEEYIPQLIHLKNAKFYTPNGGSIPNGEGVYWRGKLSSVDGFIWGNLEQIVLKDAAKGCPFFLLFCFSFQYNGVFYAVFYS